MLTDGVPVYGMRMPLKAPASMDVTVVAAPPNEHKPEQGDLANVRADAAPELIALTREDVNEVGVEPVGHLFAPPKKLPAPSSSSLPSNSFLLEWSQRRNDWDRSERSRRAPGIMPASWHVDCGPAPGALDCFNLRKGLYEDVDRLGTRDEQSLVNDERRNPVDADRLGVTS